MVTVGILTYGGNTNGYTSTGSIVIDHTKCGSSDTANYVAEVSFTNIKLATVANGGQVQNFSGSIPFDIVFSSSNTATPLLSWEIESWDGTAGTLVAHVQIGTCSHTVDTTFYILVGNASIITYQGGATGAAWPASYVRVWHLNTLSNANSVSTSATLLNTGSTSTGQIDGAITFNGTSNSGSNSSSTGIPTGSAQRTISIWFKMSTSVSCWLCLSGTNTVSNRTFALAYNATSNTLQLINSTTVNGNLATAVNVTTFPWTRDSNWHYLVASCPNTADPTTVLLYLDGILQPLTAIGVTTFATLSGTFSVSFNHLFGGILDEVRYSNVQYSADQILTEFNNQSNPNTFMTVTL